jgi:hypothetical protein
VGFNEFLNTPIDFTTGMVIVIVIAVVAFIVMKKRGELAKQQAKIEAEIGADKEETPR